MSTIPHNLRNPEEVLLLQSLDKELKHVYSLPAEVGNVLQLTADHLASPSVPIIDTVE